MAKLIKTLVFAMMLATTGLSAFPDNHYSLENDRIYIRSEDIQSTDEAFMIHVGDNIWMETNIIYRDSTGLYTFETVLKSKDSSFEKKWRCPYCNRFYGIGEKCSNPYCPSKY